MAIYTSAKLPFILIVSLFFFFLCFPCLYLSSIHPIVCLHHTTSPCHITLDCFVVVVRNGAFLPTRIKSNRVKPISRAYLSQEESRQTRLELGGLLPPASCRLSRARYIKHPAPSTGQETRSSLSTNARPAVVPAHSSSPQQPTAQRRQPSFVPHDHLHFHCLTLP